MRYVILGFCVFAAACAGEGSSAPTSPSSSIGGSALTDATHGSELPFKGTLQATETQDPANFDLKHLVGTGNATLLGRFTLTATFLVSDVNGVPTAAGTATWTAANGDQMFADVAGTAVVNLPNAAITETHSITGGTGRFARASGTIFIERFLNLVTGVSSAPPFRRDKSGPLKLTVLHIGGERRNARPLAFSWCAFDLNTETLGMCRDHIDTDLSCCRIRSAKCLPRCYFRTRCWLCHYPYRVEESA